VRALRALRPFAHREHRGLIAALAISIFGFGMWAVAMVYDQVRRRYGIDVDNAGADEASVSEALARAQQARSEAETERNQASAARTDEVVAGAAVAGANRQDAGSPNSAGRTRLRFPERRQQLAESRKGKGDREAVNSRLLADKHQGTHPKAAVTQKPSRAKASKMSP
jgi:hypothetical protein